MSHCWHFKGGWSLQLKLCTILCCFRMQVFLPRCRVHTQSTYFFVCLKSGLLHDCEWLISAVEAEKQTWFVLGDLAIVLCFVLYLWNKQAFSIHEGKLCWGDRCVSVGKYSRFFFIAIWAVYSKFSVVLFSEFYPHSGLFVCALDVTLLYLNYQTKCYILWPIFYVLFF